MKFLSWNIRGLNSPQKQFSIKKYILEMKLDICLRQEVKMSYQSFATITGKLWPGAAFLYVDSLGVFGGIATL